MLYQFFVYPGYNFSYLKQSYNLIQATKLKYSHYVISHLSVFKNICNSEYDQDIPQSQTADKAVAS